MAGRIPQAFIADLLARTDIVDLIDQRVPLKKAGKNLQACCPFHQEKSPSFTVSPDKQFYHCFGCGAHGNAISFMMEYESLEFPDAIEELANRFGLEVPREGDSRQDKGSQLSSSQRQTLNSIMSYSAKLYQHQLGQFPQAAQYLKDRGLSQSVIERFMIGYTPDEWTRLQDRLRSKGASEQQLIALGLSIQNEQRRTTYDRFRNRIMFPIRDRLGRVVGFGGRVLDNSTPKYLNSPETELYHKGRELYGLYELKQANPNPKHILVVEGYMDVVALAQFDINYAVASLGTSTTADQLHRLFRTTPEVICCYDGDQAGTDAAWRALNNALPYLQDGRSLKFIFLPTGEDPDSLIRAQGKAAFESLLTQAQPFGEFMFERLAKQCQLEGDAQQNELAHRAAELIQQVPEGFNREGLITLLSRQLRWGENEKRLKDLLKRHATQPATNHSTPEKELKLTPIRRAIAMVIQYPALAAQLPHMPELGQLKHTGMPFLLTLLDELRKNPGITTGQLLELWRDKREAKALAMLASADIFQTQSMALRGEVNVWQEMLDTFEQFYADCLKQRLEELQQKGTNSQLSHDETQELLLLLKEL